MKPITYKLINTSMAFFLIVTFDGSVLVASTGDGLPPGVSKAIHALLPSGVSVSCYIKPCFYSGDFDGSGTISHAVLVMQKIDGKRGIAILLGNKQAIILGPGNPIGNGGDNYIWLDRWKLVRKGTPVGEGVTEEVPPHLLGDALLLEKEQAASAFIYWDGKKFEWYQQGD